MGKIRKTALVLGDCVKCSLIVLDCFYERQVDGLARAERIAVRCGAVIRSIAYAGAESESLSFGVENFGFSEVEHIVGVEIFFEALNIIINKEVDGERVGYNVNFD